MFIELLSLVIITSVLVYLIILTKPKYIKCREDQCAFDPITGIKDCAKSIGKMCISKTGCDALDFKYIILQDGSTTDDISKGYTGCQCSREVICTTDIKSAFSVTSGNIYSPDETLMIETVTSEIPIKLTGKQYCSLNSALIKFIPTCADGDLTKCQERNPCVNGDLKIEDNIITCS
jgi:hypothetical protein